MMLKCSVVEGIGVKKCEKLLKPIYFNLGTLFLNSNKQIFCLKLKIDDKSAIPSSYCR
jgi:hypothetical protein